MTTKDKIPVVTMNDLTYFWATDGLPVFFADREGIEDIIEDFGFSIYYLFCNIAEDTTIPAPKTNYTYTATSSTTYAAVNVPTVQTDLHTSIVKVVNNIVGRSVSPIDYQITQHNSVREAAEYNLPAIPHEMVNRLDEFFRLVDTQHGTESIVLLTFDPSKKDSSGWGILVPDQTNTSVHCNYNPDSIVDEKPEDVLIVGSVHSHPGMAAYASGTDHSDQADFDGLHITFGWQKSISGGATQYHIEMQMGGNSWTLKPEDVFESFTIEKDPDPKVVEWSTKVKKAYPPQGGLSVSQAAYQAPQMRQAGSRAQTQVSTPLGTTEFKTKFQNVPVVNDSMPHIVVAEIDPFTKDIICPSCDYSLSEFQLKAGSCDCCDIPLVSQNDSFQDILLSVEKYLTARYITNNPSIYMWTFDRPTSSETLMKLTNRSVTADDWDDATEHSSLLVNKQIDYLDDDDYKFDEDEGFDTDLTLCCSTPVLELGACKCPKTVLFDDITDFELAHRQIGIYNFQGECFSCEHYFTSRCTPYVEAILDFATNGLTITQQISECHLYQKYDATQTSFKVRK